jgi:hypothetical protein
MIIKNNWRILLGGLLVLIGAAALLDSLNIIPFGGLLWGVLFALGGLAFIVFNVQDRNAWWAIIPGVILIGLGAIILISSLFPNFEGSIGGFIFLAAISVAFWLVYARNNKFWWAVIPGGVMASLAFTVLVDEFTQFDGGVIFLLGMAATFALLTILPGLGGNRQWPLIPAGVLLLVSILVIGIESSISSVIWAIVLIGLGVFLVVRSLLQKNKV